MATSIIYLHGFASSPGSNKAQYFKKKLAERDLHYYIPDLNVPSFEKLTLTAMLTRVAETVRDCPPGMVYLAGSSMGGLTVLHFLDRYKTEAARIGKLLLLAPALDFVESRNQQLGEGWLAAWKAAGSVPVLHYSYNEERPVHFGLAADRMQ